MSNLTYCTASLIVAAVVSPNLLHLVLFISLVLLASSTPFPLLTAVWATGVQRRSGEGSEMFYGKVRYSGILK